MLPALTRPELGVTARADLVDALVTGALRLLGHLPDQQLGEKAANAVGILALVARCAQLRDRPTHGVEHRMTARALRSTAQRIQTLQAEAKDLENEILALARQLAPDLLDLLDVGPITAAQVLVSWSHPGRFRSEAAFASFAGVSPIPASSGLTNRHRINRSGDRQLDRALHTITLIRMRLDPATKEYVARRVAEGKTSRDAQLCLKRAIYWQLFKILERSDRGTARASTVFPNRLDAI
ncbi:transposase [Streptomyces mirabilis]|uniref:transposase n=1 Tax=Streptomyces mirabilis TaxID=68239 RepID=UPI00364C6F9A